MVSDKSGLMNTDDQGISADTDCDHHSCYRGRYIILNRPDISAVECCNRACVFPCVDGLIRWTRPSMKAIRLTLGWKWTGFYGDVSVRCMLCNLLSKLLSSHITVLQNIRYQSTCTSNLRLERNKFCRSSGIFFPVW